MQVGVVPPHLPPTPHVRVSSPIKEYPVTHVKFAISR